MLCPKEPYNQNTQKDIDSNWKYCKLYDQHNKTRWIFITLARSTSPSTHFICLFLQCLFIWLHIYIYIHINGNNFRISISIRSRALFAWVTLHLHNLSCSLVRECRAVYLGTPCLGACCGTSPLLQLRLSACFKGKASPRQCFGFLASGNKGCSHTALAQVCSWRGHSSYLLIKPARGQPASKAADYDSCEDSPGLW